LSCLVCRPRFRRDSLIYEAGEAITSTTNPSQPWQDVHHWHPLGGNHGNSHAVMDCTTEQGPGMDQLQVHHELNPLTVVIFGQRKTRKLAWSPPEREAWAWVPWSFDVWDETKGGRGAELCHLSVAPLARPPRTTQAFWRAFFLATETFTSHSGRQQ